MDWISAKISHQTQFITLIEHSENVSNSLPIIYAELRVEDIMLQFNSTHITCEANV